MDAETQARFEELERACAKAIETNCYNLCRLSNAMMRTFLKTSDLHIRITRLVAEATTGLDPETRRELEAITTEFSAACEAGAAEFEVLRTQLAVKRAFAQAEPEGPPPA